jgi:CHAD domain-containing protein
MDRKQGSKTRPGALDEGACAFGAGVLLKHVQALREEVAGVHAGEADIEFIHRARVASRRLRAALPLFQECLPEKKTAAWMQRIRKVTRALGLARDTDVQIDRLEKFSKKLDDVRCRPGVNRLILRLCQQRRGLDGPVKRAMAGLIESGTIEEMIERFADLAGRAASVYIYTPALYQHSFQSIHKRLEEFLAYDQIVSQPEKVSELHEMRIHAKWLRYTLENFGPLYSNELKPYLQAVRKIQENLGDIHDCDVWGQFLPQFMAEERQRGFDYYGHARTFSRLVPGLLRFQQDRQEARAELYQSFVSDWEAWQEERIWDALRGTIQVPFPQPGEVYPPLARPEPGGGQAGDRA